MIKLNERFLGIIGIGYWGKNIFRNLYELGVIHTACDLDNNVITQLKNKNNDINYTKSFEDIFQNSEIKGVVISTPAASHYELVKKALLSQKDVFVEKPLALTVKEGKELVELAEKNKKILMVGHILHYHPAVIKLKEIISSGELGKIQYIYSNRLNIGKLRTEENILWSFAPHDISVILMLLGEEPVKVSGFGGDYLNSGIYDTTLTTLEFRNGVKAHIFVSWLHPYKEQKLIVVGSKGMAVFNDLVEEKLLIYPHNIEWKDGKIPVAHKAEYNVIPVENKEPLKEELTHFIECVKERKTPKTDGKEGLKVLQVLEEIEKSFITKPNELKKETPKRDFFVHESAYIDEDVTIGKGTKIWHFCHILKNSKIGENCVAGQNVMIGPDVTIGNNCKLQNNVSVYKCVELEDDVFVGPSAVFTNVVNPRAFIERKSEFKKTLVKKGASIGANATIVCGITLGEYSFVGAGAVVTKDVKPYALVVGCPARQVGWVCKCGIPLKKKEGKFWICSYCGSKWEHEEVDFNEKKENKEKIPLLDLKKEYKVISEDINKALLTVAEEGNYILGPQVKELEETLSKYIGVKHCVGVSSGTDALVLSLRAKAIKLGKEYFDRSDLIITTPFTFTATGDAILRAGATPIFIDIDPLTYNIDTKKVREYLNNYPKNVVGIIPVHLYGQSCNMDEIMDIASKYNLFVLEDVAQAFGGMWKEKKLGSIGTLGAFSFFPSKNLGSFGDGGMVSTNDDELANLVRMLLKHGGKDKYNVEHIGYNARLDTIQASILLAKFKYLNQFNEKRRKIATSYNENLKDIDGIILPQVLKDAYHVYHQYTIRVLNGKRDKLQKYLNEQGISSMVYYPIPLNKMKVFKDRSQMWGDLINCEILCNEVLSLPIGPTMEEDEVKRVVTQIRNFYNVQN